ncbi:MAG: zinc-ribbon domain-containing protein, partial [Candidatus Fervidibacter sp.]
FALLGLLSVTGAIGLWLLTRWGRNLVAWLQVPDILLGIVIMALAGLREVRVSGLTGVFIILGLSTIAFSVVMG